MAHDASEQSVLQSCGLLTRQIGLALESIVLKIRLLGLVSSRIGDAEIVWQSGIVDRHLVYYLVP